MQVFTEAEVRASLVFQLSKLCSFMLNASRLATGAAPWDALVAGGDTLSPIFLHTAIATLLLAMPRDMSCQPPPLCLALKLLSDPFL